MSEIITIGESAGRRREVLRILRASAHPMSIVAIADELDVHPNTVRFHLDSLVADGQVEQVAPGRKGPGRPPLMFRAVPQMDRGGTRHYRLLAEILATALPPNGIRPQGAGRRPGVGARWNRPRTLTPAPRRRSTTWSGCSTTSGSRLSAGPPDGEQQIGLRHCPFLELAETRTAVVCPIHLGLMQGALETWAAPVTVERLEAFVEPDLCLAHLGPAGAAR